jgi:hypothetical protein
VPAPDDDDGDEDMEEPKPKKSRAPAKKAAKAKRGKDKVRMDYHGSDVSTAHVGPSHRRTRMSTQGQTSPKNLQRSNSTTMITRRKIPARSGRSVYRSVSSYPPFTNPLFASAAGVEAIFF